MDGTSKLIEIKQLLLDALKTKDAGKSRSTQVQIGPSELGGCRRKVWYRLNNQPVTNNNELKLAAIMGTAIHTEIEKALADNKDVILESEVEYNGMKAHIDCWIPSTGDVIDWKTVKKQNLSYFPTQQQRWQVQVYGYLIDKSGTGKPRTVSLVAIARDGDERDVKVHSEPYNESIAVDALNWLEGVKASATTPEPEREESFCKHYCKYYDPFEEIGCGGLKKERIKAERILIEDEQASSQALEYLQLDQQIKLLSDKKDDIKEALRGITGVTSTGVEVTWTTVAGIKQVDKEVVQDIMGFVPTKQGQESIRLSVKLNGGK
jgi:CRISPR/Cas system-associated exonuclease Cas4 (RecB family)